MIIYQLIGLNYYHYVIGVEVKLVEHCNFFCLKLGGFRISATIHLFFKKKSTLQSLSQLLIFVVAEKSFIYF